MNKIINHPFIGKLLSPIHPHTLIWPAIINDPEDVLDQSISIDNTSIVLCLDVYDLKRLPLSIQRYIKFIYNDSIYESSIEWFCYNPDININISLIIQ